MNHEHCNYAYDTGYGERPPTCSSLGALGHYVAALRYIVRQLA